MAENETRHPLLTVEGIQHELVRLAMVTRPERDEGEFVVPVLNRGEIATIAEHRRTLEALLSLVKEATIAQLVDVNDRLQRDLDRLQSGRGGHAQRSNAARTPRPAQH